MNKSKQYNYNGLFRIYQGNGQTNQGGRSSGVTWRLLPSLPLKFETLEPPRDVITFLFGLFVLIHVVYYFLKTDQLDKYFPSNLGIVADYLDLFVVGYILL